MNIEMVELAGWWPVVGVERASNADPVGCRDGLVGSLVQAEIGADLPLAEPDGEKATQNLVPILIAETLPGQ